MRRNEITHRERKNPETEPERHQSSFISWGKEDASKEFKKELTERQGREEKQKLAEKGFIEGVFTASKCSSRVG